MAYLQERQAEGEIVTGLLYVDANAEDMHAHLSTVDAPLNRMKQDELCPGAEALEGVNA